MCLDSHPDFYSDSSRVAFHCPPDRIQHGLRLKERRLRRFAIVGAVDRIASGGARIPAWMQVRFRRQRAKHRHHWDAMGAEDGERDAIAPVSHLAAAIRVRRSGVMQHWRLLESTWARVGAVVARRPSCMGVSNLESHWERRIRRRSACSLRPPILEGKKVLRCCARKRSREMKASLPLLAFGRWFHTCFHPQDH